MKVVSVNIGEKKAIDYKGRIVETGIFKFPVDELLLGEEDVVNDAVVDRKYHGGIDQAVYAYSEYHYEYWKKLYPNLDWRFGMFGENLTISNLEETNIKVGNTYKLGEAIIQVSKSRQPCMKLGLVFGTQKVVKQFWNSTKCGVYFKVLQRGKVKACDELILIKENKNSPTIAEVYETKKEK
ncbi:MAG: MOSC domain-containing protein [Lutibacter sp.]|uniref:MOSC domain-containing protein n=1 Tax=Lutibacter sp. TaxID=1925666 RepID=UPI0017A171A7|nr:MOSC domain-containing protein [Lutibacter sp.]MBT8318365.1 MOSC domain-containing protein [Lutibacter sp.]NNJ59223.1 MOSC domain-containing protein [Lutibacter sp.]